jgi:hypothetical protein
LAQFEFDGRTITVIPPRELTLGDLAYMKEHFDVEGLLALEDGLGNQEPAAWRALLIASIRQVQPDVSPTTGGIDHVAITPLTMEMNAETMAWLEKQQEEAEKAAAGRARPTAAKRSSTPGRGGGQRSA